MMRRSTQCVAASAALSIGLALSGCATSGDGAAWESLLKTSSASALGLQTLDDDTIVSGLKEALQVGTRNAVDSTSRMDGFLTNELIRIALPDQLEQMGDGLRRIGFGGKVDEFEVAMNRAAEKASGEATDVFINAVREMSFADARQILQGGETAATDYFRAKTSDQLRQRFSPIVEQKMQQVGVVNHYQELVNLYSSFPLASKPDLDVNRYVTDKALDGLFTVVAQEESQIRTDPAARVTPLLKRVFSQQ
jgi:hypothetical protein